MEQMVALVDAVVIAGLSFSMLLLAHELGHAAAAWYAGERVRSISAGQVPILRAGRVQLGVFGLWGGCEFDRPIQHMPRGVQALIAAAGPVASIALGGLLHVAGALLQVAGHAQAAGVIATLASASYALGLLNLLPIPPLDGWRIVEPWMPAQASARAQAWGVRFVLAASLVAPAVLWLR